MKSQIPPGRVARALLFVFWGLIASATGLGAFGGIEIVSIMGWCLVIAGLAALPRSAGSTAAIVLALALGGIELTAVTLGDAETGSTPALLLVCVGTVSNVAFFWVLLGLVASLAADGGQVHLEGRARRTRRAYAIVVGLALPLYIAWTLGVRHAWPWVIFAGIAHLWVFVLAIIRVWDAFRMFDRAGKSRRRRRIQSAGPEPSSNPRE